MRVYGISAFLPCLAVAAFLTTPATAADYQTTTIPTGTERTPAASPTVDDEDSPEEIAKDAERDIKDSRFYNKPGATRAEYDHDWQTCRLIARGSQTPAGSVTMVYNPAVTSPLAAGIGGGIGAAIGNLIVEGEQRRANRRSCLLVKGWKLVSFASDERRSIAAMPDDKRAAFFNDMIGAADMGDRKVVEWKNEFAAPVIDPTPKSVEVTPSPLPSLPQLTEAQGAIVVGFRRADVMSAGRSGMVAFARFDTVKQDVQFQPRDWKKKGDLTTYWVQVPSKDRKATLEYQVLPVTAGDYVLYGAGVGPAKQVVSTYCLGAPTVHVDPGQIVYFGDFTPYMSKPPGGKELVFALAYSSHPEDARQALSVQEGAAERFRAGDVRNKATFGCAAVNMTAYIVPGAPDFVAPPADAQADAATAAPAHDDAGDPPPAAGDIQATPAEGAGAAQGEPQAAPLAAPAEEPALPPGEASPEPPANAGNQAEPSANAGSESGTGQTAAH